MNLLIPSQVPFSAELGVFPHRSLRSPFAQQHPSTWPVASSEGRKWGAASAPSSSSQHLHCHWPHYPQGEPLRRRRWWGGDRPLLELRGWEHFRAESQIDFSTAVSALIRNLTLSSITSKRSRSYDPEGMKFCWQDLGFSPSRGQRDWWAGETPDGAEIASSWRAQGNQIPIQTQQHFIHTLSYVLPSCNCVNKP